MAQRFYRVEPILAWTYVVNLNWFLGNGDSIPPNLRRWINQMGDQIDDIIAALPKEDGRRDIALETYCRVTRQHNLERAKAYSRLIVNPVSRERVGFFFEAHGTPVDWYKYTGEKFWIVGRQQEFPRP